MVVERETKFHDQIFCFDQFFLEGLRLQNSWYERPSPCKSYSLQQLNVTFVVSQESTLTM